MIDVVIAVFLWFPKTHQTIKLTGFSDEQICAEAAKRGAEPWILGAMFSAFADEKPKIKGPDGLDLVGEVYRKKFDCAAVKK